MIISIDGFDVSLEELRCDVMALKAWGRANERAFTALTVEALIDALENKGTV